MNPLRELYAIIEMIARPFVKAALVGVPVLVLLIALLARNACACQTIESAYATVMRSELRNIVQFQDAYRAQHGEILDSLRFRTDYRWVTGVILVYMRPTADGFTAELSYPELTKNRCRVTHVWGTEPTPSCDWTRRRPGRLF